MAGVSTDRVCDTTTTTGTGDITVAGAITGYQSLDDVLSAGNTFYYLIEAVDTGGAPAGDWEVGLGTVNATGPVVFSRTVVINSSNGGVDGSVVTLAAGTKRVHLIAPAQQVGLSGGVFILPTNLTAQNFTTATAIPWTSRQFDTTTVDNFHEDVTNPTRITIPDDYGVCYVRLAAQVVLANITSDEVVNLMIRANGFSNDLARQTFQVSSTTPSFQIVSPIMLTSPTDYYELKIQTTADTSVDVEAAGSFFQIEVLQ